MDVVVSLIGGLGMFLFGMSYMNEGLQKLAGKKMKEILAVLTKNKLMGVIVGTLVTGIIQSSSAVTVMVVSFVNTGLMDLYQAVGVIMGANIGTTVTSFLITMNITKLATLLGGIGVFIFLSSNNAKIMNLCQFAIGFGILFMGMDVMANSMNPLKTSQHFISLLTSFKDPFIGILMGFAMTAVLQSSSATIGLLIAVSTTGLISFRNAFPVILGQNIGTCITALLASIGANITAKRAAVIHLLFNIIGTIIFMLFFRNIVEFIVLTMEPVNIPRQIALGNIWFNILSVMILYPFSDLLVKSSEILVKGGSKKTRKTIFFNK